jgi:hypothetical protein
MVEGYQQLYARKYAPSSYRKEVQRVVSLLRTKYSVSNREDDDRVGSESPNAVAEQQMIEWKD